MLHRLGWALSGALTLIVLLAFVRAIEAGPLDPPGPVGSTMRSLDTLVPSWDRHLTTLDGTEGGCHSQRFECVLPDATYANGAAVLDRETGLVWQRAPGTDEDGWYNSMTNCSEAFAGGRFGWRLPTLDELTSLLRADGAGPFDLGSGGTQFWSATLVPGAADGEYLVDFDAAGSILVSVHTYNARAWCVRGGAGGGQR